MTLVDVSLGLELDSGLVRLYLGLDSGLACLDFVLECKDLTFSCDLPDVDLVPPLVTSVVVILSLYIFLFSSTIWQGQVKQKSKI